MTGPHFTQAIDLAAWLRQHLAEDAALCSDSRKVQTGDAFLAWRGHAQDGREHIAAALQAGAQAIVVDVTEADAPQYPVPAGIPCATFNGLYRASGEIAAHWYGEPSRAMDIAAITGTNGKTTCAWWLSHVLNQAGQSCGYVGTLGIGVGADVQLSGLTSPEALQLQQSLATMRRDGVVACAIEASSIGLDQGRLSGTAIKVAVFTNFTQDHLDYHHTMDAYAQAKRQLFTWPQLQAAVANVQDAFGAALVRDLAADVDFWSVAVHAEGLPATPARLQASAVQFANGIAHFTVTEYAATPLGAVEQTRTVIETVHVQAPIVGLYNIQNALAVIASLRALGHSLAAAAQLLLALPAVPGRMQMVQESEKPLVVVDYAHTPDALRAALQALRPVAQQRGGVLRVVFGCGGDRDSSKRPLMAMAAAQNADHVCVTSDNPRSENPLHIIEQVCAGLTPAQRAVALVMVDRAEAIHAEVGHAAAHDVVLIAGKGHEPYQEVQGVKHAFSDEEQAVHALTQWRTPAHTLSGVQGVSA